MSKGPILLALFCDLVAVATASLLIWVKRESVASIEKVISSTAPRLDTNDLNARLLLDLLIGEANLATQDEKFYFGIVFFLLVAIACKLAVVVRMKGHRPRSD